MIERREFGRLPDGRMTYLYTLTAGRLTASVSDYGGTIVSFAIDGVDVVLGFDDVTGYLNHTDYMGGTIGRVANRIAKGKFTLEGVDYTLAVNNGPNCNHGGLMGFDKRLWKADIDGDTLILRYTSPHMEEGFPGELTVTETFTLSGGALRITQKAKTDRTTVVNLTNHPYFNLDGQDCGHDTLAQFVKIPADTFCAVDEYCLVTGERPAVKGTVFDLDGTRPLAAMYPFDDKQIINANGFDHSFPVDGTGMRTMLEAWSEESGIRLTVRSDQKCVHLYTGNYISDRLIGKGGAKYGKHFGYAVETQGYADDINSQAPTTILRPDEEYSRTVTFELQKK